MNRPGPRSDNNDGIHQLATLFGRKSFEQWNVGIQNNLSRAYKGPCTQLKGIREEGVQSEDGPISALSKTQGRTDGR